MVNNICFHDGQKCGSCGLRGKLLCHFQVKDTSLFIIGGIGFWTAIIIGIIQGYQRSTLPIGGLIAFFAIYVAYLAFFFQIWENKILCSHCPYYAFTDGKRLSCYANAGIYKLWPYNPTPMTKSEQIQFLIGFGMFYIIPTIFLIWAKSYLAFGIASAFFITWITIMQLSSCKKCPNFSCPLSRVSKEVMDKYLQKNEVMRKAWEEAGYQLDSDNLEPEA